MNNANHRNESRRKLIYYLNTVDNDTGVDVGKIVDITTKGILLIGNDKIESNIKHNLKIEVEDDIMLGTPKEGILLDVISRWSKPDINPNFMITGYEFVEPTKEQQRMVKRLINSLAFQEQD